MNLLFILLLLFEINYLIVCIYQPLARCGKSLVKSCALNRGIERGCWVLAFCDVIVNVICPPLSRVRVTFC